MSPAAPLEHQQGHPGGHGAGQWAPGTLPDERRPSLFRGPWEADVSCQSTARRHLLETPTRFQPIGPGWQLVAGAPSLWKATTAQMLTLLEERISLPVPALLTS